MSSRSITIFKIVSGIPKGKVATYKQIAILAGIRNPRQVGKILHLNKDPEKIPCYRVVKSDGTLATGYAYGGKNEQKKRLETDGLRFSGNKIKNFRTCIYHGIFA